MDQLLLNPANRALTETLSPTARQRVADELKGWFALTPKVSIEPVQLKRLMDEMTRQIVEFANNFQLEFQPPKVALKVSGKSEHTLALLTRGNRWFEGHPTLVATVVKAALNRAK